jgi:exopolysaccharide biosynthesis polyprenyl glycosylphosphotransferase
MLQRDRQIRTQIHQLADAALFAMSLWLAYFVRSHISVGTLFGNQVTMDDFEAVVRFLFALVPAAPLVLESQGFYNRNFSPSRPAVLWPLLKSCFIVTIGLVLLLFFFRESAPRGVMVLFGAIAFVVVWVKEEIIRFSLRSGMALSQYQRRVLLAGIPLETARFRQKLRLSHGEGVEVVADFNIAEGTVQELIELLHDHAVNGVFISARHTQFDRVENIIKVCETEGVEAWLVADFIATQIARASFDEMLGHPLIVFRSTPESSWQMLTKQLLDFFGTVLLLAVGSLPMLVIALLIKLTSPGPVLFRQERSGVNGVPFTIFKFRTMATNAEQLKHELAAMNEMSGPVFKVTNDPRITPLGKFLRKWSLDELPQLFNVLRGEMSLVGPRPLPVDEVKRFSDLAHRRRLSVKPGLTCLWQVQGRNKISDFQEWVRLDLEYIDNWSIWLDLQILLRTIPAVLFATGAK